MIDDVLEDMVTNKGPLGPLETTHRGGKGCNDNLDRHIQILSPCDTDLLTRQLPQVYTGGMEELFLAALCQAYSERTGSQKLRMELVKIKGRESAFVSCLFENPTHHDLGTRLMFLQKQLRRLPAGMSLSGHVRSAGARDGAPSLQFQFQADPSSEGSKDKPAGLMGNPIHLWLAVDDEVKITWSYDRRLNRFHEIVSLSRAFQTALKWLTVHCSLQGKPGAGPCDMPAT